jgi:hypothetical protein
MRPKKKAAENEKSDENCPILAIRATSDLRHEKSFNCIGDLLNFPKIELHKRS